MALPTLDNTWWSLDESTPLAYTDTIENTIIGTLAYAENATRKTIGTYAIKQGNLSAGDNYTIDFTEGTITVDPKTEQTITITGLEPKTYGDTFKIGVTSTSGLSDFTYSSDKPEIAMVSPDGTIEIKGIGIANISVTQAGNIEYAAKTETEKLVVNKKNITVTSVDIDAKTAVLDGILEADKDAASLDFDKITTEIGEAADETNTNVVVKGFELKGNKAANYKITTESINITVPTENIVTITVNAEKGTVEGAGKYIKGANVTLKATTNSGYKFIGWYNGEESVSENETYTFAAESDITLEAKFKKRSSGGGGSSATSTYTVKFETNGGSKVESVKVVKNDTVNEPDAPTKDGFEFAGWFADEALKTKFNFSKSITGNVTVYAAWNEKTEAPKDDKKDEKNDDKTEEKNEETAKSKFNDVNDGDWFGDAVKYVTENKLMNGTSDETFAPYDNLTRAMLVTILYRAAGEPAVNKSVPFSDVTADSYFANAVIWAQQNGIVSGMTETEFAPDENITREQIATIIYRYAKAQGYDVSVGESTNILSYADFDEITEYAISAMQYAVGSGLLRGKTESTLNPKDNATRAEIATILQRFIEANK